MNLPLGIQLNNPGNIERRADKWQGMAEDQPNSRFIKFVEPKYGIRAMMIILLNKQKRGLDTVEKLISEWAPPSDHNPTDAYIHHVADHMGVEPDEQISLIDHQKQMLDMVQSMVIQEQGYAPMEMPVFWYSDDEYQSALNLVY